MGKTSFIIITFGILIIGAWLFIQTAYSADDVRIPEVAESSLEQIDPRINTSYIDDLTARAVNDVGINLEL